MNTLDCCGRKILITNHHLTNFAGSELTTFYLAKEFKDAGCDVTVATFSYDYPIKQIFESYNIKAVNVLEQKLDSKDYDLIWSHHSPVLHNLIFENGVTSKRVIFSSLSPFEPLEAPPVFINMLSLCLANSMETRNKLIYEGVNSKNIIVFPNSVNDRFFEKFNSAKTCDLKNICLISNHLPEELNNVTDMLTENNIHYEIFGLNHSFKFITPEHIEKFDAIITIGRSVQYGLAMGIPVFCYDRFGGPGWITLDNINDAEYHNFSGRCTNKKMTSKQLYNTLINNFPFAFSQRIQLYNISMDRYNLKKNMSNILGQAICREIDLDMINRLFSMTKRINEYYERELKIEHTKDSIITEKQTEILNLRDQLNHIYDSKAWKILKLYYKIRDIIF